LSIFNTGKIIPLEILAKIHNTKLKNGAYNHSEETKVKIGLSNTGKIRSEEFISNLSKIRIENFSGINNPFYNHSHSTEFIEKRKLDYLNSEIIICPHCGYENKSVVIYRYHFENCKQNPNYVKKEKIIEYKKREIVTCPHCQKIGDISAMKHWHFENCKHRPKL
jgi:hypothetical protein